MTGTRRDLLKSNSVPGLVVSLILEHPLLLRLTQAIATEDEEVLAREKFKKLDREALGRMVIHALRAQSRLDNAIPISGDMPSHFMPAPPAEFI